MEKDVEVIEIDGKQYAVMHEAKKNNTTYLYLSNIEDMDDIMIRKTDPQDSNLVIPLENDKEFEIACGLFAKFMIKE